MHMASFIHKIIRNDQLYETSTHKLYDHLTASILNTTTFIKMVSSTTLSWDVIKDTYLETHPDFPKNGILFYDIFPLFKSPDVVRFMVEAVSTGVREMCPDAQVIAGLESRGFLLGPMVALALGISFIPIRKRGKLPGPVISVSYEKEYGKVRSFEMCTIYPYREAKRYDS